MARRAHPLPVRCGESPLEWITRSGYRVELSPQGVVAVAGEGVSERWIHASTVRALAKKLGWYT